MTAITSSGLRTLWPMLKFAPPPLEGPATEDALVARAAAATREMGGRWLLLGPDCSINPETPARLLHAVGAALRDDASAGLEGSGAVC